MRRRMATNSSRSNVVFRERSTGRCSPSFEVGRPLASRTARDDTTIGGRVPRKNEKPDLDYQRQQDEEDTDRNDPLDRVRTLV